MINFNGDIHSGYFAEKVHISSPYNISDYAQILLNGELPEGEITVINPDGTETPISLTVDDLLIPLCKCNYIEEKLLEIEKCKGMSIAELQNLSDVLPYDLETNEIEAVLSLNKYERDNIFNSGFVKHELLNVIRELLKAKEKFGPDIEYTNSLNKFLHTNHVRNTYAPMGSLLNSLSLELIGIYYRYPHIANALTQCDKSARNCFFKLLHATAEEAGIDEKTNRLKFDWIFDKKHIERLNKYESLLSQYDGMNINVSNLIKNVHLFETCNYTYLVSDVQSLIASIYDDESVMIAVQPELGENERINPNHAKQKLSIMDDDRRYFLPNLKQYEDTVNLEPCEVIEIKELGLRFEYLGDNSQGAESCYEMIEQIVDKVNAMVKEYNEHNGMTYKPMMPYDIYNEVFKDYDENIQHNFDIIHSLFEKLQNYSNYANIPALSDLHISYQQGSKYMFTPNISLIECSYAIDSRLSLTKNGYLVNTEEKSYDSNIRTTPMFIMSKDMIEKLGLQPMDDLLKRLMADKDMHIALTEPSDFVASKLLQDKFVNPNTITPFIEKSLLADAFMEKYRRIPRIISQVAVSNNCYFNGNIQECVDSFNYKNIAKISGAKTPIMIKLSSAFNWNNTPLELQQLLKYYITPTQVDVICRHADLTIEFYNSNKNDTFLKFMAMIDKIPEEELQSLENKIIKFHNETDLDTKKQLKASINDDMRTLILISQQQKGLIDARKAETQYDYSVINNSSSIMGDDVCIMTGPYKMYFLNSMDTRHFSVGYDTSCCQHMGGAGEECVIAATASPYCGTIVIETDGQIKAQAFVWEAINKEGEKVLVLDNIEFANDRNANDYIEILYAFCKESPYDNIHMGLSYNAVTKIGRDIEHSEHVRQPSVSVLEEDYYSDYDMAVALKTHGQVEFHSPSDKYYTYSMPSPTIIESPIHCINKDSHSMIAQHYDEAYDVSSKTTLVFSQNGIKKEADAILPTYPFNSTTPLEHNHMMKWDNIESNDIAITVIHTSGKFLIKPISFDGKEFTTPNQEQRDSIFLAMQELKQKYPEDKIIIEMPNELSFTNIVKVIETPDDLSTMCTKNYLLEGDNDLYTDSLTINEPYKMIFGNSSEEQYDEEESGEEEYDDEECEESETNQDEEEVR